MEKKHISKHISVHKHKKENKLEKLNFGLIAIIALLISFNQWQISSVSGYINEASGSSSGGKDLSNVDLSELKSTGHSVAALFPVENIKTAQDAVNVMIPTGTPEYSEALGGITFDDPVTSMEYLAKWYPTINSEIKNNNPEIWQRYLNLAAAPRGISCEFCCGVGPQGINADGSARCGCQHLPALLGLTLGLMKSTDYSDAKILREVLKWKALFFPKNMVELALTVAGGDTSKLEELPGMVGGC